MDNKPEINWMNVVFIREFQSYLDSNLLKEISMISKLTREKLKPLLFKNLMLNYLIWFEPRTIYLRYNDNMHYFNYDKNIFEDENIGCIKGLSSDFIIALNNVKKFCKSFYLNTNCKAIYYMYPLIKKFDNLTQLKICRCEIAFIILVNIGKTLPSLKSLVLDGTNLVKSTIDGVSECDIIFPPNISYLKLSYISITSRSSILDPSERQNSNERGFYTYRYFTFPKVSIPSLKCLDHATRCGKNPKIEEFLAVNPNVDSLLTRQHNLDIRCLNSLKNLDIDEFIGFDNIDQAPNLSSINSLTFLSTNFDHLENFRKLCQLCTNVVNITIQFPDKVSNFQFMADNLLAPALSDLHCLKSFTLLAAYIGKKGQILDFNKLIHIEKLKIKLYWIQVSNIKFDRCKNLKKIELVGYGNFNDKFKKKITRHNWKFKFSGNKIKGYKI